MLSDLKLSYYFMGGFQICCLMFSMLRSPIYKEGALIVSLACNYMPRFFCFISKEKKGHHIGDSADTFVTVFIMSGSLLSCHCCICCRSPFHKNRVLQATNDWSLRLPCVITRMRSHLFNFPFDFLLIKALLFVAEYFSTSVFALLIAV